MVKEITGSFAGRQARLGQLLVERLVGVADHRAEHHVGAWPP